LIAASSTETPAVQAAESELNTLRQNVLGIINNLLVSLNVKKDDLERQESESLAKFSAMPTKAKRMISIERQRSIKDALYTFLLNKREENALTQAMVENNARMVDAPSGSPIPIYPSRSRMMLIGFLLGLFVPAVIFAAQALYGQ